MVALGVCNACQESNHTGHVYVIKAVPKGMIGGTVCRCKGECVDGRYRTPLNVSLIEAVRQELDRQE